MLTLIRLRKPVEILHVYMSIQQNNMECEIEMPQTNFIKTKIICVIDIQLRDINVMHIKGNKVQSN